MRRVTAMLVMISVVALGAAACGSAGASSVALATPAPSSVPTPTPTPGADSTAAACTSAITVSVAGVKTVTGTVAEMMKLAREEKDEAAFNAKADKIGKSVDATIESWTHRLKELSGEDIDGGVKSALSDAADTLERLNNSDDGTDFDTALAAIKAVPVNIKKVCA